MRFPTKILAVGAGVLFGGSLAYGYQELGTINADMIGSTAGAMIPYGIMLFIYSKVESKIESYKKQRAAKKSKEDKD